MPWHRRLQRRLNRWFPPVWRANVAVVVSATLVTALAGLVADDVLSKDGRIGLVWSRFIAMVVALVLLGVALRYRGAVHRTTGTLFQVQVLDEKLADNRATSRTEAELDRMAVRSITRWVDFRARTSACGVIELADVCQSVADILEEQINSDSPEIGNTVAPVMVWPMAMAVGTQLPHGDRLQLQELQDDNGNPTNLIPLLQPARPLVQKPLDIPGGPTDTGHLGVWIALTVAAGHFDGDRRWPELGVTDGFRLTLGPDLPHAPSLTNEDIAGLGAAIATRVVTIRNAHPDREMVMVAMMTKIVAMAVGWHVSQAKCRFFHRTHLMWFDPEVSRLVPMRVKEQQPGRAPGPVHA